MKKLISQAALGLLISGAVISAFAGGPDVPMIMPGLYAGLGGSWNTVDEDFNSTLSSVEFLNVGGASPFAITTSTAFDNYNVSLNRLAPMAQLGYWAPIDNEWLWGVVAQWKYLGYETPTDRTSNGSGESSGNGQALGNANSILPVGFGGILGAGAQLDQFSSQTHVSNEVLLLVYFGAQYEKGYFYLGLGPALFTAHNTIYASGQTVFTTIDGSTANTVANSLSVSTSTSKVLWGGAAQLGYNYYFKPTWFLGFNYTYALSGTYNFNSGAMPFSSFGPSAGVIPIGFSEANSNISFSRSVSVTLQEVMFSINKVFEL